MLGFLGFMSFILAVVGIGVATANRKELWFRWHFGIFPYHYAASRLIKAVLIKAGKAKAEAAEKHDSAEEAYNNLNDNNVAEIKKQARRINRLSKKQWKAEEKYHELARIAKNYGYTNAILCAEEDLKVAAHDKRALKAVAL